MSNLNKRLEAVENKLKEIRVELSEIYTEADQSTSGAKNNFREQVSDATLLLDIAKRRLYSAKELLSIMNWRS